MGLKEFWEGFRVEASLTCKGICQARTRQFWSSTVRSSEVRSSKVILNKVKKGKSNAVKSSKARLSRVR